MELTSEDLGIQQQHRQGFLIRQEEKKEVQITPEKVPSKDITAEQWFWDMAVMS